MFETDERGPRLGVAIGEYVLDLYAVAQFGYFEDLELGETQPKVFRRRSPQRSLLRLGRPAWRAVRQRVSELLRHDEPRPARPRGGHARLPAAPDATCGMLRPVKPANYTDFYSSIEHATNVGTMFRDPEQRAAAQLAPHSRLATTAGPAASW